MGQMFYGRSMARVKQAEIDAKRITQKSGNERRAAESNLQRFSQSLSNQKRMKAAGVSMDNVNENIARNIDAATYGDFMTQVAVSEELGANIAMASAMGIGGSSVELYNETIKTTEALKLEQSDRQFQTDLIGATRSRGNILDEAVSGMDNNVYLPNMDYTQYVDAKKPSLLGNLITLGLAAGATAVAGPQAGMAVIGMRESQLAANNGDFASASSSLTGAMQMGLSAARDTHANGGNYWKSSQNKLAGPKQTSFTFGNTSAAGASIAVPKNYDLAPDLRGIRF